MAAPVNNFLYRIAAPAAIGMSILSWSIYDVRGGSRAVIFDRLQGVKEGVVNEGTHFLVPWLQKSIIFDVRTKPRTISTMTGSKDLQMVSLTLRVLHRPDVKSLPKIYQVSSSSSLLLFPCLYRGLVSLVKPGLTLASPSPSAPTTTSASSPPSATRSSRPSLPSSMPPSSSRSVRPSLSVSATT